MRWVVQNAAGLVLLGVALASSPASAQTAGPNGIKVGEGRLHPFVELEWRYDSAAGFYGPPPVPGGFPVLAPEWLLYARPGLRLELSTPSTTFNLSGAAEYVWYTGLVNESSSGASRFQGYGDLSAQFNKDGTVGFDLADRFTRSDQTTNPVAGIGVLSLYNEARVGVPIRPGGGALEISPSAAWGLELFEPISPLATPQCTPGDISCDPAALAAMNYNNFNFALAARWRFLPKTAVNVNATFDTRTFTGSSNLPVQLLKAVAGLSGLISAKVAVVANAGYAHDFVVSSGARTAIGHLEIAYLLSDTTNIKGGYLRTLEPVPVFGTFGDDRVYLDARALLGGRLTLHAYAGFDYLSFYGNSGRNDTLLTLNVGPDYQFTPWLIGALGYVLSYRDSSDPNQAINFVRHEGYARVTLTY
ncbi:MAG: hypothetical protein ACOZIN_15160 [Myxococcota bacterium]